jgi:hypothetical protein
MPVKSSGQLGLDEINSEHSKGNDLGAYRSTSFVTSSNRSSTQSFKQTNISFLDFYNTERVGQAVDMTTSQTWGIPPAGGIASVLIVAGGGGGWFMAGLPNTLEGTGGGGAGGCYITGFDQPLPAGGRVVSSIGGGGALNSGPRYQTSDWQGFINSGKGSPTSVQCYNAGGGLVWNYNMTGGGVGAGIVGGRPYAIGSGTPGGSGGGGDAYYNRDSRGSADNPAYGNPGGRGTENNTGGGGGGWGPAGRDGPPSGATGGDGKTVGYYGYNLTVGGGGGSGGRYNNSGQGGSGGGGPHGSPGGANTGGGAGGGLNVGYSTGGSGRVVIWYRSG